MVGERGRMRRSSVLVGGALLGLLLAGCTGEREQPPPLPSAGLVTSPSSSPSESPAPQLPEAAKANTPAGAEAFARYALSLYGYTFQTGDTWPMKAISGSDCSFCQSLISDAKALHGKGWSRVGTEIVVRDVLAVPNAPEGSTLLSVLVDQRSGRDIDRAGKVMETYDPVKGEALTVALTRTLTSWSLFDVGGEKS